MIWRYPNFRKHPYIYIYIFLPGERQQKRKTAPWFLPGRWRFWVGAPWFTAQHGWGAGPPSQSVSGFSPILKTLRPWIRDSLSPIIEVENDPPLNERKRSYWRYTHFPLNHDYGRKGYCPWELTNIKATWKMEGWKMKAFCFQGQKENLKTQGQSCC